MSRRDEVITELTKFFTGPSVVIHSIGLGGTGPTKIAADKFFAARDALGIRGYADAEEAKLDIEAALKNG